MTFYTGISSSREIFEKRKANRLGQRTQREAETAQSSYAPDYYLMIVGRLQLNFSQGLKFLEKGEKDTNHAAPVRSLSAVPATQSVFKFFFRDPTMD